MWARLLNIVLGVWLMASPSVLGYVGQARTNSTITGALAASFACIAIWGVTRPLRWLNVALGAWLIVAGWVLGFESIRHQQQHRRRRDDGPGARAWSGQRTFRRRVVGAVETMRRRTRRKGFL